MNFNNRMIPLRPVRFWLLFLTLSAVAILFAGRLPAAPAAGKNSPIIRKHMGKKPIGKKPIGKKPIVKLGTAYTAELRRK